MKKALFTILFAACFLTLFSCSMVTGKGEAEDTAASFFKERIQNGWTETDHYYSKIFWDSTGIQKWSNIRNLVLKAMGPLKSFSLQTWNVQSKVHTNELSGTIVRLVYETEYEKGKGIETLVLHKPLTGKNFSIVGHNINSEQIQKLIDEGIQKAANTISQ